MLCQTMEMEVGRETGRREGRGIPGRFGNTGRRILWSVSSEEMLSRLLRECRWRRRWRRLEKSRSGWRCSEMWLQRRERSRGRCLRKRRTVTWLRTTERGTEQRAALA